MIRQGRLPVGAASIPQADLSVEISEVGIANASQSFICNTVDLFSRIPRIYSVCPFAPQLLVKRVVTRELKNSLSQYFVTYSGLSFDGSSLPDPVYSLQPVSKTEPISTHKKFVSAIGGKPSAPLNGAIFVDSDGKITTDDSKGVFKEFTAVIPVPFVNAGSNVYGGVESFEDSQVVFGVDYVSTSLPSGESRFGYIDTPTGPYPKLQGAATWRLTEFTWTREGYVYHVRKSWTSSGLKGWDTTIYTP